MRRTTRNVAVYVTTVGWISLVLSGCDSRPSAPAKPSPPSSAPASQPVPTGPQPRIQVDEPILDLGQRWSTEPPIKHNFVVKNAGQAVLNIKGVMSSCGCTTVGAKDVKIEPGKTWPLPVELDLRRQSALVGHKITLFSNDPAQPKCELKIRGFVRQPIVMTPPNAMYFGQVTKDETRTKTLTIKNHTDESMDLKVARCVGKTFTAKIESVKPGKECRLVMTARPPYKPGVNTGRIELTTGVTLKPKLMVRPQILLPERLVMPKFLPLPQPLPDGAKRVLSLRNNGPTEVKVLRVTTPLKGVTTEISSVRGGKVHNISVRFPPGLTIPPKGSYLVVHTDDKEYPKMKVGLFGQRPPPTRPVRPPKR